jgi:hypothetical protein
MVGSLVRVRQGGTIGGGLVLTTQVQIAFVSVPPAAVPPPLDADYVYLKVHSAPLPSLTTAAFLAANTPAPPDAAPTPLPRHKKARRHPLVALQAAPPGPRGNALAIVDGTLHLTVDRSAFHELGIPRTGKKNRRAQRELISLRLPLAASARAARALAPPRVGAVDVILSCGSTPAVPPEGAVGGDAATLHGVAVAEMREAVPRDLCRAADAVGAGDGAADDDLLEAMDAAQRVLTGVAVGGDGGGDAVAVLRRRYVGLCNGDMWESAVRCAVRALADGVAEYVVVGALGAWSPSVNDDCDGFGGDAGVVAVVRRDGRAVTYELRPRCDPA